MQYKTYLRLTDREREEISRSIEVGRSCTDIAEALGRAVSTIAREIRSKSHGRSLVSQAIKPNARIAATAAGGF